MTIETHPLQPFLPPQARLLMLGCFLPSRQRWWMDLFYTEQKAAEILCEDYNTPLPRIGESVPITIANRNLRLWRMPSSSRAYPMKLEKKARYYRKLLPATTIHDTIQEKYSTSPCCVSYGCLPAEQRALVGKKERRKGLLQRSEVFH